MKETKFFEKKKKNLACLVYKVSFSASFFSSIGVFLTQSDHSFLDNGSENGVIFSNPWGFLNTGKKLVFYLIIVKG